MDIADFTFYVIDQNLQRRNALARLLSKYARAVPLDNVSEGRPLAKLRAPALCNQLPKLWMTLLERCG